jgi:hypothetical protein
MSNPGSFSWFANRDRSYRYNGSIKFYSHEYSSLMIIKPLTDDSYRALMITEVGIKILDLEIFSTGDYKIHYCIDQMNRKSVIKMMADCLYLMIYPVPEKGRIKVMKEKEGDRLIIRSKHKGGLAFSFIDPETEKVNEIKESGYLFEKLNFKFDDSGSSELESVDIWHDIVKLKIHFSRLHD